MIGPLFFLGVVALFFLPYGSGLLFYCLYISFSFGFLTSFLSFVDAFKFYNIKLLLLFFVYYRFLGTETSFDIFGMNADVSNRRRVLVYLRCILTCLVLLTREYGESAMSSCIFIVRLGERNMQVLWVLEKRIKNIIISSWHM